ncbi:DUF3034 family protein [soil metagenome]
MTPRIAASLRRSLLAVALASVCAPAFADDGEVAAPTTGGKLLLTGGVTQLEGAGGGGLTPWALIGGYGTQGQWGASAFYTRVNVGDYHLDDVGALVSWNDRIEFSVAQQRFNTEGVGAALGLGQGFTFKQDIIGVKVRIAGEAVLDADRAMPQIAVGLQYKKNDQGAVLGAIGAKDDSGLDIYVSATKLFLAQGILLNGTVRFTKANQIGILGFGGDLHDSYKPQFEVSAAYLLTRKLAIGAEYRTKPNNLGIARESDWYDVFVAYAPTRHVSVTVAYADLGNIVIRDHQRGIYASLQVGF